MAAHEVKTTYLENLSFEAEAKGQKVRIDGEQGLGPKKYLLAGLASCSGLDVVDVLRKMRVAYDKFEIEVEADQTNEHPKVFTEIRMLYRFYGMGIKREKVERAVDLSQESYCGVAAMLRKNSPIRYKIEILETVPAE